MSNLLNSEDFGLKIYNRFPLKYREDDILQDYALKRYLQSLSDGGFKYSIDEINGITHLIDPYRVDSKVLPVLFKQYGLELFNGIPESYLRYLLPRLGEAWSKKGSLSVVEFIASSLSGMKTKTQIVYGDDDENDDYTDNENPLIKVILEIDSNIGDYFPEAGQFKRLLTNFVPFYSDLTLVYSYVYFSSQVVTPKDNYNLMNIQDVKNEKGSFTNILKEPYTEIIKHSPLYEIGNIKKDSIKKKDSVSYKVQSDSFKVTTTDDVLFDKEVQTYSEKTSSLKVAEIDVGGLSLILSDSGTFTSPSRSSFLNDKFSTLGNFYTNSVKSYDIITSNGVSKVVYN